jgi:glycine hydroxymethyltransferase
MHPSFTDYCKQVITNAQTMAEVFLDEGLDLVSGGTDNHLILLDLTNQGITGLEAEQALEKANITVNKNTIPRETRSPFVTSGLRVGTPAVTSRGMKEEEMRMIARMIAGILKDINNDALIHTTHKEVEALASTFPLYPEIPPAE